MQTKINRHKTPMPALLLAVALLLGATPAPALTGESPDLVLLVVVDQLRGDMPWRFRDRLGDRGFRYLMDQGISFSNARYRQAYTVTAPGHATLVTGGNASQHGIPANEWLDRATGKLVNCLEDDRSPEIGLPAEVAEHRSPRTLGSSTFSDELVLASAGRSRVFAASIKDRSAIIMGGHFGKAFWYSEITGQMISSAWYFETLPDWVRQWNSARPADRYAGQSWSLLHPPETYVFIGQDDRVHERPEGGMGRVFPHVLGHDPGQAHYEALPYTPMGDELTLDFIKALVSAEQPGLRGHTDVLAVSFSVTDYVGHAFGPFSLEAEDNFLRLDRTLADLFSFIDREVGLE
jgi:predicted AlkP superfamily pyrophosphatase or phosphodiesterase